MSQPRHGFPAFMIAGRPQPDATVSLQRCDVFTPEKAENSLFAEQTLAAPFGTCYRSCDREKHICRKKIGHESAQPGIGPCSDVSQLTCNLPHTAA
ncbi:hypothetical protein QR680_009714 [Steinernema hermaphroditum]|uniref:Uncharacterized protein n=1 Tax=Steinernema hermaphroditum TaxID=289476 RepID=A0AA39IND5_9BILA|nr:hypothetical protein QR680_009714 [Steinernema hermaphroditum]